MKNVLKTTIFLFGVFFMLGFCGLSVRAAAEPELAVNSTYNYFAAPGLKYAYSLEVKNYDSGTQIMSTATSNSRASKPSISGNRILFYAMQPGKVTLSCEVRKNGKTYNLSKKITIYAGYPFKSLKIGKYECADKYGNSNLRYVFPTVDRIKVRAKFKSGWTLKRMYYAYVKQDGKLTSFRNLKNGKSLKLKEKTYLFIDAKNSKGKIYHTFVNISR